MNCNYAHAQTPQDSWPSWANEMSDVVPVAHSLRDTPAYSNSASTQIPCEELTSSVSVLKKKLLFAMACFALHLYFHSCWYGVTSADPCRVHSTGPNTVQEPQVRTLLMKRAWTGEGSHVAEFDTWLAVGSCESPRQFLEFFLMFTVQFSSETLFRSILFVLCVTKLIRPHGS